MMAQQQGTNAGWSVTSWLGSLLMPSDDEPSTAPEVACQPFPSSSPVPSFFPDVLEVGVTTHSVSVAINEEGLTVVRKSARGAEAIVGYHMHQIEWFAIDENEKELLLQYHDFNTDDKFQVSFRTPYFREIFFSFSYYLERKGQLLHQGRQQPFAPSLPLNQREQAPLAAQKVPPAPAQKPSNPPSGWILDDDNLLLNPPLP